MGLILTFLIPVCRQAGNIPIFQHSILKYLQIVAAYVLNTLYDRTAALRFNYNDLLNLIASLNGIDNVKPLVDLTEAGMLPV